MEINLYLDLDELIKEIEDMEDEVKLQSSEYSYEVAHQILNVAKSLCPVDTGRLRDSGKVIKVGNKYAVLFDCEYAYIVHENMVAKHPNGGTAKFLDIAVQRVLGSFKGG